MNDKIAAFLILMVLVAVPAAAQSQTQTAPAGTERSQTAPAEPQAAEPQHVTVQHILIGFQGSVRGKTITRSPEEARALAYEILERAVAGEDFDALVKQYTDDAHPGIYAMANHDVPPLPGERARAGMVKAFGDVSFSLEVDEVGIGDYDASTSRYGWHIIKRVE